MRLISDRLPQTQKILVKNKIRDVLKMQTQIYWNLSSLIFESFLLYFPSRVFFFCSKFLQFSALLIVLSLFFVLQSATLKMRLLLKSKTRRRNEPGAGDCTSKKIEKKSHKDVHFFPISGFSL